MNLRRPRLAVSVAALVIALAGCSGGETDSGGSSDGETATVEGIPQAWIEETREGWPDSDGFGAPMPHLQMDGDCLLADSMPEVLGTEPEVQEAGWGPFGGDAEDKETYQYQCGIWAEDRYAGSLRLYVTPDAEQLQDVVQDFTGQGDTAVQENTVSTVSSSGQKLHALKRWYPTNPQGEYQVMYADKKAGAVAVWQVNSLDKKEFKKYSEQQAADDLMGLMAEAGD